jgi:hypothetical protein
MPATLASTGRRPTTGITVSGFNSGAYLLTGPQLIQPALEAALKVRASSLSQHYDNLRMQRENNWNNKHEY